MLRPSGFSIALRAILGNPGGLFLIKNSLFVQSESELIHFFESRFLDESEVIHSEIYTNLYGCPVWLLTPWERICFASIAFGYPQTHFWGVSQTPSLLLCDDSDADDACDAVLRISLYHIPDSASLASSASFWFCVSRSIIVFVSSSSKLQASFHYKRDGGDDGDGSDDVYGIWVGVCKKDRHLRHYRHARMLPGVWGPPEMRLWISKRYASKTRLPPKRWQSNRIPI